ncbi:hypothetical protein [Cellulosilyticum ruminicola]|uniref:hypothetical protein n=1 Tax=Cellulosilyticum ruminicola TaxID=425254 RepID=UPI00155D9EE9|nr:hypothetical protein [Cellulosilyticum ruminicola]
MAFQKLVAQMALSEGIYEVPSQNLKKQFAFLYLIAFYQTDYKKHEGEVFYIEPEYDDIHFSIGGPTYLLEEKIGTRTYGHEIILEPAKAFLEGKEVNEEVFDEQTSFLIHQAKSFIKE